MDLALGRSNLRLRSGGNRFDVELNSIFERIVGVEFGVWQREDHDDEV